MHPWRSLTDTSATSEGGLKPGAAIFELLSAWFVCPWVLRPAVPLCRRHSNTSSAWKCKNTKSWVRARLNHCSTPPPRSPPSLYLPTEYRHVLWTEINTLPLQRHTAVNVICMVTKKLARFSSYSRHCFFWHLFLGISVMILNVITFFRPLYALPLLYRWSFKSIRLEHLIHFCFRVNPHKCRLSERLSSEFGLVQVWFFHLPWFPRCKGNAKWAQHVRDVGFVFILFTFTSISDSLGWGGGDS